MVIPSKRIYSNINASDESPQLVDALKNAGRQDDAMQTLGDMAFGVSGGELFERSVSSGFKQGIANKALRATRLKLKESQGETGKMLSKDEANDKYGITLYGDNILTFEEDITEDAAKFKMNNKLDELVYNTVSERNLKSSKWNYLPILSGNLLGNVADPGELTLGFLTGGLSSTRYASFIGKGINNSLARTTFRAGVFSAIEGSVGEPAHHILSDYLGETYTWKDTAMNMAFAAGLGTVIGGTRSLLGDVDQISNIEVSTLARIAEDQQNFLFGEKSNKAMILADSDAAILASNKGVIDANVETSIKNESTKLGRDLTTDEIQSIRETVEWGLLPTLREQAKKSAINDIKNSSKINPEIDKADPLDLNYDTDDASLNSDTILIESIQSDLNNKGLDFRARKVEEGEVDINEPESFGYSEAAILTSKKIFPKVDVEYIPDNASAAQKSSMGYYDIESGKIYISKDNIKSADDVARTVLEEVVGHKGWRSIYRSKKQLKAAYDYAYKQHKAEIDQFKKDNQKLYGDQFNDRYVVIDEFLAKRVAENGAIDPGVINTLKADIKKLVGLSDVGNTTWIDSVTYAASLKMRSRALESAITQGINVSQFDDHSTIAMEEMGISPIRFSKKASQTTLNSRAKVKKIKEAYAKKVLENAVQESAELESIKDVVDVKLNIDGKEHVYKLPIAKKLNALKDINVYSNLVDQLSGLSDKDRIAFLYNHVERNTYNQAKAMNNKYQSMFHSRLIANNLQNYFKSEGNRLELYKAAKGQSKNQDAIKVFEIIQNVFRTALREQNLEGGRTAFLSDHVIPRIYSKRRIQEFFGGKNLFGEKKFTTQQNKEMKKKFVDWYLGRGEYRTETGSPRLDLNRMYADGIPPIEDIERSLEGMFESIMHKDSAGSDGIVNSANLANQSSVSRKIHFINAEDEFFHDKHFGSENTISAIYRQMETISTRTALLRNLGTNPERMIKDKIIPSMKDMLDRDDIAMKDAYQKMADPLSRSLKIINRAVVPQESQTISTIVANLKAFTNIAKMGGLLFTSSSDVALRGLALNNLDVDGTNILNSYFGLNVKQNAAGKYVLGKDDKFQMLNSLAMNEAMSTAFMNRFDPDNLGMNAKLAKIQHQFFNINGMNWWNKWMREGFILGAVKRMGANSNYSMADLKSMPRASMMLKALEDSGISETDWELIRNTAKHIDPDTARVSSKAGKESDLYLTIDMVSNIDRKEVAKAIGKAEDSIDVDRYINQLESKYSGFLGNQMDVAILTPGIREQRLTGVTTVEGSIANQIAKVLMQYKSFPISAYTRIISPQMQNIRANGFKAGGGIALLGAAAMATSIQMLSMQLKEISQGRSARPWDGKLMIDAFIKSGVGTIVMDLLRDYEGVDWGDILGGPVTDLTFDTLGLASQAWKSVATDDEFSDFGIQASKFLKHWTPLNNHPLVKASLTDPIFNMAADYFNPESLQRTESWYRNQGQFYYMNSPTNNNQPFDLEDILSGLKY